MKKMSITTTLVSLLFIGQAFAIPLSPTDDTWAISNAGIAGSALALGNMPGYDSYLQVSSASTTGYVNTYLQFDLSSYPDIDSGILWLYDFSSSLSSLIRVYMVPNNWDETTLTGLTQPSYIPMVLPAAEETVSGVGWKSWDVSGFAAYSAGEPLSLRLQTWTSGTQKFYSSESPNVNYRPYLDVTQSPAPVPEPSTVVLLGCGLIGLLFYSKKRQEG